MRSKNISVRTPNGLLATLTERAKALGYPSLTAYFIGLARYDLLCQREHTLTQPWADLSLAKQDAIDDHLCRMCAEGRPEKGQLLEHLIAKAKTPDAAGITAALTDESD